ncbi:MAG: ribonuclease E/G [bacterium]|nr:ribonuclease E/G [bacterium]
METQNKIEEEKNIPREVEEEIKKEITSGQEIYIEVLPYWTRISICENRIVKDFLIDIPQLKQEVSVGNIYKGVIQDVIPSMQAVFINVGADRNVYLFVPSKEKTSEYKVGQEIVVQVKKESVDGKGAKVSDNPTLPGKYIVLTFEKKNGVSKKIKSRFERNRLKKIVQKLYDDINGEFGVVARTEAENIPEELIMEDFQKVYKIMKDIKSKIENEPAPITLWSDSDILKKAVRDFASSNLKKFISNSKEAIAKLKDLVQEYIPKMSENIEFLYEEEPFIFQKYKLEEDFFNMLKDQIEIEGGVKLIFNETEAFTSIDVNTASYTGAENLDITAYQANLMAIRETIRQIELRKIGGIIIIDLIDIKSKQLKNKMINEIKRLAERSREKTKVFGLTRLGLLEISRKKSGYSIKKTLMTKCPTCGDGYVNSDILNLHTTMLKIYRHRGKTIKVSPENYKIIDDVAKKLKMNVVIQPKYGINKWGIEV